MTTEAQAHAEADVVSAEAANVAALDVKGLQDAVVSMTSLVAEKNARIAELEAIVAAATEFKAAQEKAAAEAKIAARNAALVDVVGTEQAASLQVALASLDDASFAVAVGALSNKMKVEEASPEFKEVGVEGTTDAAALAAEAQGNRVMDYLKVIAQENKSH